MGAPVVSRTSVVLAALLAACGDAAPYMCGVDSDCTVEGVRGVCTMYGYCAFEDMMCPSGLRYHESAGALAGVCVGQEHMRRVERSLEAGIALPPGPDPDALVSDPDTVTGSSAR
jgi:hypothetical protein